MEESGNIREDIKAPEGEVGDKLSKLRDEGKDLSKYTSYSLRGSLLTSVSCRYLEGYG